MTITKLEFENKEDYIKARDIRLNILEKRGWKPDPALELSCLMEEEVAAELKPRLEAEGIPYEELPPL